MASLNASSILGLAGLAFLVASGGFHYEASGAHLSVAISPSALVAWALFTLSAILASQAPSASSDANAKWWQNGVALFVDFGGLLTFLMLPLAAVALCLELGQPPPPWEYSGPSSSSIPTVLFFPLFAAFWSGLGFALHPGVTTPGQLIAGVSANVSDDASNRDLALYGGFAYYGLFIPFFKRFAERLEPVSTIRRSTTASLDTSEAGSS